METPNGGCMRCEKLQVSVTVYWDFENCTVPSDMKGFQVVSAVRSYVKTIGGILKNISAFGNLNLLKQELRTELQQCGVLLHDVSSGKPSAADMALMVEFLKLACDCPPPHRVVLISGDRDFSNVLNVLVFRGYEVTLIHSNTATEVLKSAATNAMEWRSFLGKQDILKIPSSTPPSPLKQPKNDVSIIVPKQDISTTNNLSKTTMPSFTENEKKALKLMEVVLPWLKKEFFKPTETIIQNGCKREYKKRGETFTTSLWNDVLSVIQKYPGFKTYGQGPSRLVYFSSDIFPGIDPSEAPKKAFSSTAWNDLVEFLKTIHPTSKLGRFGFAEFLREKGPLTIKTMPLAKIAQLIQVATNERLLKFDKNVLLTVGPEENKQQLPPTPSTQTEIRDGDVIKCINDILLQVKRIQIGGLSAHLERKGLLGYVKQKGSLKGFIQSAGTYDLQMDNKNGLWIVSKDPLFLITSFVSENGGRVNIGTLSGYVHRIGKIKDGLKKFLVASEMFDFESTKDGGNWVILKSKKNISLKEEEEEEISEKVENGEDNQEEIFEEKSSEFLMTEDNMGEFVELEQNDTQEFQQTDQSFDGFDEFDEELKRALELSLSQLY